MGSHHVKPSFCSTYQMCLSVEAGKRKEASSQNKQRVPCVPSLPLTCPSRVLLLWEGQREPGGYCAVAARFPPKAGELPSHSVQESSPILVLIPEPVKDTALA